MDLDIDDLVVVAEFCGGGFGSKITAHPSMAMTALLARKVGRPVMLRVTRYEENYIGRARPGFQAHARLGFKRDGRMSGLDLYIVQDQGPYGRSGDIFTAATVASPGLGRALAYAAAAAGLMGAAWLGRRRQIEGSAW